MNFSRWLTLFRLLLRGKGHNWLKNLERENEMRVRPKFVEFSKTYFKLCVEWGIYSRVWRLLRGLRSLGDTWAKEDKKRGPRCKQECATQLEVHGRKCTVWHKLDLALEDLALCLRFAVPWRMGQDNVGRMAQGVWRRARAWCATRGVHDRPS